MRSDRDTKQPAEERDRPVIPGQVNLTETAALICDVFLLCVFFYDRIVYGLNMWPLIVPLLAAGLALLLLGVFPESYVFDEESLVIRNPVRVTARIPYGAVFNYEATRRDGFVNLLQRNRVKVYYTVGNRKKLAVCRPRDADAFEEIMKKRCPESDEDRQENRLNVFFK